MRISLTKSQAHAMTQLTRDWKNKQDIGVSLNALEGLRYRGVVERKLLIVAPDTEVCLYRLETQS